MAEIFVPAPSVEAVKNDGGLMPSGIEDGYVRFAAGSGKYIFSVME